MIFETVLDNPDVVNFDSYVQTLRRNMKEAMCIAQTSVTKQLKRHADLYNRRVKGGPIDPGDWVLLANKGAHEKGKFADLWEDAVFTVVGLNAESYLQNSAPCYSGVIKTVHHNLIMPVNILPLPENDLSDSESIDSVTEDVLEDASNYRTQEWVSQLPSDGMNKANIDDVDVSDVLESSTAVDTVYSMRFMRML